MRVQVTLQNILDYGLDTITGNTRENLLINAAEAESHGYHLYVNIPDAEGGDKDIPAERNIFEHYSSDLPAPEGSSHLQDALDLRDQAYIENPCNYRSITIGGGDLKWICNLHNQPSKHSIEQGSYAPCLAVDPYID